MQLKYDLGDDKLVFTYYFEPIMYGNLLTTI